MVPQLVIPVQEDKVLKDMHEGILGGHLGEEKRLGHIRERFYWHDYYNNCVQLVQNILGMCIQENSCS